LASFKKRANGTWQAAIYTGRDAKGKQLFKYVTRDTLKECKAAARELEQELEEGRLVNIENIRLITWVEQFLEINKNSYASSTRSLYKTYLDCHFKPFFGQMKLKQINDLHVKTFQNYLLGKMSATSARRIMGCLRRVLNEALKKKSPANEVPLPRENKSRAKAPSTKEFNTIHRGVKGTEYEVKVLLAGWCGFRRGEIYALKPNDFNFKESTIRIDESYSLNEEGEYQLGPPKSENGFRTEVAPEYLMNLLKDCIPKGKNIKLDEQIFKGRPDNFTSSFAKIIRRKKLPKYRFHDLRHYHATWLLENGIPDKYAAKRMGQTEDVLRKIYQHLRAEKQMDIDTKILTIDKTTVSNPSSAKAEKSSHAQQNA
jgi:integrase